MIIKNSRNWLGLLASVAALLTVTPAEAQVRKVWDTAYQVSDLEAFTYGEIAVGPDNEVWSTGVYVANDTFHINMLRYDSSGNYTWGDNMSFLPIFDGYFWGMGVDIVVDADGYAYILAMIAPDNDAASFGEQDLYVTCIHPEGWTEWSYIFNNKDTSDSNRNFLDSPVGLKLNTAQNLLVVVGDSKLRDNADMEAAIVIGLDPITGARKFESVYKNNAAINVKAFGVDDSSNVYLASEVSTPDSCEVAVLKYNSSGSAWSKVNFNPSTAGNDIVTSVVVTPSSGSTYISGTRSPSTGNNAIFAAKYDSNLALQWSKTHSDSEWLSGDYSVQDASGNLIIVGTATGTTTRKIITLKYNSSGTLQWTPVKFEQTGSTVHVPIAVTTDASSNIYIAGEILWVNRTDKEDVLTLCYSSSGAKKWVQFFGENSGNDEEAHDIAVGSNGYVYTGAHRPYDRLLVKYAQPIKVLPFGDSFVRDGGFSGSNFGTSGLIEIQKSTTSGSTRQGYLKFNIGAATGVTSAKLRFYGALSSTGSVTTSACRVPDVGWTETGINWNNKCPMGTAVKSVAVNSTSYKWYELDVTSYIQAEKNAGMDLVTIGFLNSSTSSPLIKMNSRNASSNKPELIIQP